MLGSTTKQVVRIGWMAGAVLVLAGGQFWVWPSVHEAAVNFHMVRTSEQQQSILSERLEEARAERQYWENARSQLTVMFPEEGNTTQVVERLEVMANETGLRLSVRAIEELSPVTTNGGRGLRPVVVTVEMTAPAERLLQYMDRVEHVPEVVRIWRFSIVPVVPIEGSPEEVVVNESGRPLHRLTMRVAFYLQQGL